MVGYGHGTLVGAGSGIHCNYGYSCSRGNLLSPYDLDAKTEHGLDVADGGCCSGDSGGMGCSCCSCCSGPEDGE